MRSTQAWVALALLAACSSSSGGGNNQQNVYCGVISGCAQYKSCCTYGTPQEVCHFEDSSGNVIAQLPPECTSTDDRGPSTGPDASADGSADVGATALASSASAISIAADGSGVYGGGNLLQVANRRNCGLLRTLRSRGRRPGQHDTLSE